MTLHIHGQRFQHDEVLIEGTVLDLLTLRDLVDRALNDPRQPEVSDSSFYTEDGEGYCIRIRVFTTLEGRTLPYPIMRLNHE